MGRRSRRRCHCRRQRSRPIPLQNVPVERLPLSPVRFEPAGSRKRMVDESAIPASEWSFAPRYAICDMPMAFLLVSSFSFPLTTTCCMRISRRRRHPVRAPPRVGTGCECGKLRHRHPHGRAVQSRGHVRGHHRHRRGGSRIGRDRLVPEFNYMDGETVRSSSFIHHFCLFLFSHRNVVAIIILSPAFSVVKIHRERTSSSLLSQVHRRLGLRGAERDVGGRVGPRRRRGQPVRQGRQAPAERGRQPRRDAVGPGRQAKKTL